MPELPEVETIRKKLNDLLAAKSISDVQVLRDKSFQGNFKSLAGIKINSVGRRAKIIQFNLSNSLFLIVHLKMTGQLIYDDGKTRVGGGHPTADWVKKLPSKHTRVIFIFNDGSNLFFNDQRVFGWIRLINQSELEKEFAKYGPDINDSQLTAEYLYHQWQKRSIPVKQALMLNQIMAGVGNIYACDGLNLARINPRRPAKTLTLLEVKKLMHATQQVIDRSIELGGTTFDGKYVDVDGFAGGYQNELKVYGREGEECPNCGSKIEKIKLGGRGTYFCPNCQK